MSNSKFGADVPSEDESYLADYIPNPLDAFDSCTYNFKFYMTPDGEGPDSTQQYVIAQSGVTEEVNIVRFDLKHIQGYDTQVRSGTSVGFELELEQVFGADLLDQIYEKSTQLGVVSYQDAPYYLELTFKGRDGVTGAANENILSARWMWNLHITRVEISIKSTGATFRIKGVSSDDLAYTNQTDLGKATNLSASTVDEYFTKLADTLNNREELERPVVNQTIPDIFEFDIDPILGAFKLGGSHDASNTARATNYIHHDHSVKETTHTDGTSISDMITVVIGSCFEMQELIKNQNTAEDTVLETTKSKSKVFKKLIKVHTSVEHLGFDYGRGEYAKRYRYIVTLYDSARLILQTGEMNQTSDSMQLRYDALKYKGVLQKRYEYLFSGMNDQVIDVNIRFNNTWYISLPKQAGYNTIQQHDSGGAFIPPVDVRQQSRKDQTNSAAIAADDSGSDRKTSSASRYYDTGGKPIVAKFREDNKEGTATSGGGGSAGDGDQVFATMYTQAMDSSDMIKVDITIKGDPDWLQAPYENNNLAPRGFADLKAYENSEFYTLFSYRTPQEYDAETGLVAVSKNSQIFSGIYGVHKVQHTFENGMFTQRMTLYREKIIQVDQIKT